MRRGTEVDFANAVPLEADRTHLIERTPTAPSWHPAPTSRGPGIFWQQGETDFVIISRGAESNEVFAGALGLQYASVLKAEAANGGCNGASFLDYTTTRVGWSNLAFTMSRDFDTIGPTAEQAWASSAVEPTLVQRSTVVFASFPRSQLVTNSSSALDHQTAARGFTRGASSGRGDFAMVLRGEPSPSGST
ncbi:hypothetical protein FDECE_13565 [Fusarium decemcellulare]|nr:hypothetical protein FDECE_13565 [Fusarium decemcellulare]